MQTSIRFAALCPVFNSQALAKCCVVPLRSQPRGDRNGQILIRIRERAGIKRLSTSADQVPYLRRMPEVCRHAELAEMAQNWARSRFLKLPTGQSIVLSAPSGRSEAEELGRDGGVGEVGELQRQTEGG